MSGGPAWSRQYPALEPHLRIRDNLPVAFPRFISAGRGIVMRVYFGAWDVNQ